MTPSLTDYASWLCTCPDFFHRRLSFSNRHWTINCMTNVYKPAEIWFGPIWLYNAYAGLQSGGVLPLVPQNNLGPLPSITLASWLPSSSSRYISEKLYVWYPWKRTSVPFLRTIEFELSTLVGQSGTETELLGQEDPHLPDQLCNLRQASELLSCCVCVCVF